MDEFFVLPKADYKRPRLIVPPPRITVPPKLQRKTNTSGITAERVKETAELVTKRPTITHESPKLQQQPKLPQPGSSGLTMRELNKPLQDIKEAVELYERPRIPQLMKPPTISAGSSSSLPPPPVVKKLLATISPVRIPRYKESPVKTRPLQDSHGRTQTHVNSNSMATGKESHPRLYSGSVGPSTCDWSSDDMTPGQRRINSRNMMGMQNVDQDYLTLMEKNASNIVDVNEEWD